MNTCTQTFIHCLLTHVAGTLFVGNLSFSVKDYELSDFFANEGFKPTAARVITQPGGRSKG